MSKHVQVILTTGTKDIARAVLGLQAALAAVASQLEVDVFLTPDATEWACEPRDCVNGQEVYDLLDLLIALGARITCCSACALENSGGGEAPQPGVCELDRAGSSNAAVLTSANVQLTGLATLMERVASGAPTVTF